MSQTTAFDERALQELPAYGSWMSELRSKALAEFESLPVPSQDTEEWRYTDLSDFQLDFLPPRGTATQLAPAKEPLAKGVIVSDLDVAARSHPELVEQHLHSLVPAKRTKFTALHAAFRVGGIFVYVPPDVAVEIPVQAVTGLTEGAAVFPHTLIVVGAGAELTFIDRFTSPDLERGFSDAVTEIRLGQGAHVRYVSIQDWGAGVTHLGVVRAEVGRDAELRTLSVGFGGDLARVESEVVLAEPGGFSEQLGVFFADGRQHFDHRSIQDHVAPNCTSDLLYKGALRDESRAVFSGWVHVRPGAQRTNAMQTSRNIVLSERAKADAIPNLEIEANDVKCGHAASVGPVDDEAIFYLESRGIPHDEAERLIVTGFFQEVLDRVRIDQIREEAETAIAEEIGRVG